MFYANKRTILVVLTMCAIALSSVKAQEAGALIQCGLKSSKSSKSLDSDALVAKSSKACKNESKLIAKFRTNPKPMLATVTLPQHSEIIEVAVAGIVEVAITTTYYQMINEIGLGVALEWPTLIDVNDDLGFVYPGTVLEESKCDPNGFCRFFTETTIYVLESADPDWVDKFEEKLLKTNSNSKANVNFEVNFSKEVSRDTVELVEY